MIGAFMVGGGGGSRAPVARYRVTSSDYSPTAGTPVTITAQLLHADGTDDATAGVTVNWTKTGTGGSLSAASSVTNGSGVATITLTPSLVAGVVHQVRATDSSTRTGLTSRITVQEDAGDPLVNAFNTKFNGGTLVIVDSDDVELLSYTAETPIGTETGPGAATLNFVSMSANAQANTALSLIGKLKSAGDTDESWLSVSIAPDLSGDIVLAIGTDPTSWNGDAVVIDSASVVIKVLDHYTVTPATLTTTPGATIACVIQARAADGTALPISGLVITASVVGNGSISAGSPATTTGDGKATVTYTAGTLGQTGVVHVVDTDAITGDSATLTAQGGVVDSFNRANSASLGNADSGQAWENPAGGGTFNIDTNRARGNGDGTLFDTACNIAVIESTLADCVVAMTGGPFIHSGTAFSHGIVFRWTDVNNYWVFVAHDVYRLYKIVAGVQSVVAFGTAVPDDADDFDVVLSGNDVTPRINGVPDITIGTVTDAFNATATKHGILTKTDFFGSFSAQ